MKLVLTIILMNGYVYSFEMNDVKYSAHNCERFFKRLTKVGVVNKRTVSTYNKHEVFAYTCSHQKEELVHRLSVRLGITNER